MPILFRLAFLIDVSAIWCDTCFPALKTVWPFSLNPTDRITVLLLASFVLLEAWEIGCAAWRKLRPGSDKASSH